MLSFVWPNSDESIAADGFTDHAAYTEILEKNLEETLGEMTGVSQVKVMITLENGVEYIPAYETEKGGSVTEEQHAVVLQKKDGEEAFVLKERLPVIKGVLVVAKGVENIETERSIIEAVKTVFDISAGRVKVLAK